VRDVMAGGDEVVNQIVADLAYMSSSDMTIDASRKRALEILHSLTDSEMVPVAEILAERDRTSADSAVFDVNGHLRDLSELLEAH